MASTTSGATRSRDLVARCLAGVKLVTSDADAALVAAISATLPGASWQRCRTTRRQSHVGDPEALAGLGQGAPALDLRPARRRPCACPARTRVFDALGPRSCIWAWQTSTTRTVQVTDVLPTS